MLDEDLLCPPVCDSSSASIITFKLKGKKVVGQMQDEGICPSALCILLPATPGLPLYRISAFKGDSLLQGHVRVGPETVLEPAHLVTRPMEDFVTWVDTSKIRRKVLAYNDKLDDYDLLN